MNVAADKSPTQFLGRQGSVGCALVRHTGLLRVLPAEINITVWCNEDAPLIWGT